MNWRMFLGAIINFLVFTKVVVNCALNMANVLYAECVLGDTYFTTQSIQCYADAIS